MVIGALKKLLTGDVVKPVTDLIDNLVTSDEERLKAKAQLQTALDAVELKAQERIGQQMNNVFELAKVEASQGNFLQRSWRPLTMLVFVSMFVLEAFGLVELSHPDKMFEIIQLSLGLFIGGRTLEKLAPTAEKIMKR